MKKFTCFILAIGSIAFLVSCSVKGPSTRPADRSLPITRAEQATLTKGSVFSLGNSRLVVEDVLYARELTDCPTVAVCVRETTGRTCEGMYRFRWFEPDGYEAVSERTAWKKFSVNGGQKFSFVGISPVRYAKRFVFELAP